MDTKDIEYSLKNIPIPTDSSYIKCLIEKTESFIKKVRWAAFWYERKQNNRNPDPNENQDEEQNDNFGFKSPRTPPQNRYLKAFEKDMYQLINKVEFDNRRNHFQRQLRNDVRDIKSGTRITVAADKSPKLYEMSVEDYGKMLLDNITKEYKKTNSAIIDTINREARDIADTLSLADRVEKTAVKSAFITLKDHKPNFRNNPTCRLINPTKSEIGHISKSIVEKIVAGVCEATRSNQWRNTSEVIDWFKAIPDKPRSRFVKFDIVNFYPSITEELLDKALEFASQYHAISESDISIIKHARKSLLFSKEGEWVKKTGNNELFDVTMGSYDGAEVCELVGLYLLSKLQPLLGDNRVRLYRDDGLSYVRSESGRILDRKRKDIHKLFNEEGLSVTVEHNLTVTDFLDVTFDLSNGKYSPFRKPDSKPLYVHSKSNHPPSIIKELPNMINRRLSSLSYDEAVFNSSKAPYEEALRDSGYPSSLSYVAVNPNNRTKKSRNPPYSSNVKTHIGKEFLRLVNKHFNISHPFHRILNRNTLKLSYSCMPNVANIIKQQNSRLLKGNNHQNPPPCNCQQPANCPLPGACRTESIVYKATVTHDDGRNFYYGTAEELAKKRISEHYTSFRHRQYKNNTELSKFIWQLKDKGKNYNVTWEIARKCQKYKCGSGRCDLCLTEKMLIARNNEPGMLNSRSELISKCRHRNKFLLCNVQG